MSQTHLFIMDPVEKLNLALDSSLRMAYELFLRGHHVYSSEIKNLFWKSSNAPHTYARRLEFEKHADEVKLGAWGTFDLRQFTVIHMRKDPPFDIHFFTATWFLDHCPNTLVLNSPHALRALNEKMVTLQFPKECKPTLVSYNPAHLLQFIREHCVGDAIVKPLYNHGGEGILRIILKEQKISEVEKTLTDLTEGGTKPRLVQTFDPSIFQGEVRVFSVGGKPISWCLKVPPKGTFLANTRAGATLHPYNPSSSLVEKVSRVAKDLVTKGIFIVGMDILSEEISEINVTSPRLLSAPTDPKNYYPEIVDWIEQKLESLSSKT